MGFANPVLKIGDLLPTWCEPGRHSKLKASLWQDPVSKNQNSLRNFQVFTILQQQIISSHKRKTYKELSVLLKCDMNPLYTSSDQNINYDALVH